MNAIERRLREFSITLPTPTPPMAALLTPTRLISDRLIVSAQTPKEKGKLIYCGKVGEKFDLEGAQLATRLCMLNVLAHAKAALQGDLPRIKGVITVRGYINVTDDFSEIAEAMNGASRLLLDVLGPLVGAHTRTAVGAASMPFGVAAEVEAEFWVEPLGLS